MLDMKIGTVRAVAMLGAALLINATISAQPPAATNPLDLVPEKMPFGVPYGAPISLERAQAAINAALAKAKKRGLEAEHCCGGLGR